MKKEGTAQKTNWKGRTDIALVLIEKGADLNIQNKSGDTPLHWASWKGHRDIAFALIENGADLHIQNNLGNKPHSFL